MNTPTNSGLSNHPLIVAIATLAALVTIFAFVSNRQALCAAFPTSGYCPVNPYTRVVGIWKGNEYTLEISPIRSFVLKYGNTARRGKVTSESDGAIYRFNFADGAVSNGQLLGISLNELALSGDVSGRFVRVR